MTRRLSFILPACALILSMAGLAPARAESVLDRIQATGVLKAGTREQARPFAFRNDKGELTGFSVDLLHHLRANLEQELKRPVRLDLSAVDADTRIDLVENGSLDITCDIASKTWVRERRIDFSLTFFFNGTRVLTTRSLGLQGPEALSGRRIGVVRNSATIGVINRSLSGAQIVEFSNMGAAMQALQSGTVDGISNISIVLRDLQRKAENPGYWLIVPRAGYLNREPMACILPQNDSRWRDTVDHTITRLLAGIEEYRGPYFEMYQLWFGPGGDLHYPLSRDAIEHFSQIRSWIDD